MGTPKMLGGVGLAITFVLNLVAWLVFRRTSAEFFSIYWWACWSPSYIVWTVFFVVGVARSVGKRSD